ncbi:MAG: 3-methyl-2-oxobutanoate hydroxymethyltransferase [Acidobacteria bacterium]|nr:3-methyl-2-oxobutanoate hydroxymethyltransferase [Acidobacteriota bacterium]
MGSPSNGKITVPAILDRKNRGRKITMLTAYDFQMASLLDQTGIDILLVGDSLATVVLGYDNSLPVTMEEMLHHTRAVSRGTDRALLVADLPFLSFHLSIEETVRNAGRFLKEGGAQAVKLEGGVQRKNAIQALVAAEIPVMGHVGLTPQSIHRLGGYRVQGRSRNQARRLLEDAQAVEEAGAFAIVLEGIPGTLASVITRRLRIPTIGIGAGVGCDGQVLVTNDLLGMDGDRPPRFVRRFADLRAEIQAAVGRFLSEVEGGTFPSARETYSVSEPIDLEMPEELEAEDGDS